MDDSLMKNLVSALLTGATVGITIYLLGNEYEAKFKAEELAKVKESYHQGLKDAYAKQGIEENIRFVEVESITQKESYHFHHLEDLRVVTVNQNFSSDEETIWSEEDTKVQERILVDTKKHYFYKEILKPTIDQSLEDYLLGSYTDENIELVYQILSAEKEIPTLNKEVLEQLGISTTSDEVFHIDPKYLTSTDEVMDSITEISKKR